MGSCCSPGTSDQPLPTFLERGVNFCHFGALSVFQPKVIWMKNQMEIGEDPRYLALMNQGICSLEIRKPSPFDGGVYTCKAVNPLGEASVNCKLNVTGMYLISELFALGLPILMQLLRFPKGIATILGEFYCGLESFVPYGNSNHSHVTNYFSLLERCD